MDTLADARFLSWPDLMLQI